LQAPRLEWNIPVPRKRNAREVAGRNVRQEWQGRVGKAPGPRQTGQHRFDGDLRLQPSQFPPDANMGTPGEPDLPAAVAVQIEAVRFIESRRIPVGRHKPQHDESAAGNRLTGQRHVLLRNSKYEREWWEISRRLLDGPRNEC